MLLGIVMLLCGATAVAQRWELLAERGMGFCNYAYDPVVQKLYLVTTRNVLYASDDFGAHTRRIAKLPTGRPGSGSFLAAENGYFFLSSTDKGGGYFRSSDEGATWVQLTAPNIARSDSVNIRYIPELDELLTLTHRSSDHGMTWRPIKNDGTRDRAVSSLTFTSNSAVWYGLDQFSKRLVRTTDNGATWNDLDTTGLATVDTPRLYVHPSDDRILFLAGDFARGRNYLYRSTNAGATWTVVGANRFGITESIDGEELIVLDASTAYLHVHDFRRTWSRVFVTTDVGLTWKSVLPQRHFRTLWVRGSELYGWDIDSRRLLKRRPGDSAWRDAGDIGFTWTGYLALLDYRHLLASDGAAPKSISSDLGATWMELGVRGNAVWGSDQIVSTKSIPPALFTGSSRSIDGGKSWMEWGTNRRFQLRKYLAAHPVDAGTVYAVGYDTLAKGDRVFVTTDAGGSWDATAFPILDYFFGIAPSNPMIMFGWTTYPKNEPLPQHYWPLAWDFCFSLSGGKSWSRDNSWRQFSRSDTASRIARVERMNQTPRSATIPRAENVVSLFVNPRNAGESFAYEYYWYDNDLGDTWEWEKFRTCNDGWLYSPWSTSVWEQWHGGTTRRPGVDALHFSPWAGDTIIAFCTNGIRISTNHGKIWTGQILAPIDLRNVQVAWLPRPRIFGSSSAGVYQSDDLGTTWNLQNDGLYASNVDAIHLDWLGNLYAVSDDGIYRWDQVLDADAERSSGAAEFALLENYPNPVRAATTITFTLPARMHATLRVYNALGAVVATLSDAELQAGAHSMEWSRGTLPAGLYIVQLRAGKQSACRSIVVAR